MTSSLILLILSIIGTLDAAYLSYAHLYHMGACSAGSGCGEVMASAYSSLAGIPLSTYGLGLYMAIVISSWRSLREEVRAESIRWVSLLALVGNLPTLFLLYLQAAVINAWCPFCLLSTAVILLILIVSILHRRNRGTLSPFVGSLASRDLVPVVLVIILAPATFIPLKHGVNNSGLTSRLKPEQEIVAMIGDREITVLEMDRAIGLKLYKMRNEYRKEWLDDQVLEKAATDKGVEVRALIQNEVQRTFEITEEEIDVRYREIKRRLPRNVTKEMVTDKIREELRNRKRQDALNAYAAELELQYGTTFAIPTSERFAFDPNPKGGPVKGSPNAPVTIVEFSNLNCSHCARAHTYLNDLIERRGDDIRVIFKHLLFDIHPHAKYAAEVAACAQKQGKFWQVADVFFQEQEHLKKDKVLEYAKQAGLDLEQLNACLESGEGARSVNADIAEADALGIPSTPTFFINGHYIGSLPEGGLDALIDQEMVRIR
jgi:uncharacterized membrane protein/predicted DsbA family dithiol-disulfide isomerase